MRLRLGLFRTRRTLVNQGSTDRRFGDRLMWTFPARGVIRVVVGEVRPSICDTISVVTEFMVSDVAGE
jgi:hypothetical protein